MAYQTRDKERGGCLTVWLVLQIFTTLFAVVLAFQHILLSPMVFIVFVMSLINLYVIIEIWNWKAWAVKSFIGLMLVSNILQILMNMDPGRQMFSIAVNLAVLAIIIPPKWEQFE